MWVLNLSSTSHFGALVSPRSALYQDGFPMFPTGHCDLNVECRLEVLVLRMFERWRHERLLLSFVSSLIYCRISTC